MRISGTIVAFLILTQGWVLYDYLSGTNILKSWLEVFVWTLSNLPPASESESSNWWLPIVIVLIVLVGTSARYYRR